MKNKSHLIKMIVIILCSLLLLVPACGDNDDKNTPAITPIPTTTTANATKAAVNPNQEPVKIGAITSWSGPGAMSGTAYADFAIKLVEWQVKQQGGILGGREVKVVKFDDGTAVAQGVAGVKKLVLDENVSAIVLGGVSGAEYAAISDECEKQQVLFIPVASVSTTGVADKKFTVEMMPGFNSLIEVISQLVTEELKPKTVAFLITGGYEDKAKLRDGWKQRIEASGIDIVYSDTTPAGTMDFSPFLTKQKKANPDVLVMNEDSEYSMSIAKQMVDLGGWGRIQVVGMSTSLSAAKSAGAEGWLCMAVWNPAMENPASKQFLADFQTVNGKVPGSNDLFTYLPIWSAVEAIKFAGTTDRLVVAQAARSGNLIFETPMGLAHITTDGQSGLNYTLVQIQKGGTTALYKP